MTPGLVVIGGDSCSEGCKFESQHHILDGHFSHLFDVRIVMFVQKRPKINEKEAEDGPFFQKRITIMKDTSLVKTYFIIVFKTIFVTLHIERIFFISKA